MTTVPLVDRLDLDELPIGAVVKRRVALSHDGLGYAVGVPVLVARGRRDGPVFGITAALHGNEVNGVPVIHHLMRSLDVERLRGTVVGVVVVNVPGFRRAQRVFEDGADLNHAFPGQPDGPAAQQVAHRFIERIGYCFDRVVDLHTASVGRVNSLYVRADLNDPATAQMALLQRPQIVVHNPANDMTLRGRFSELGKPAITVEIGDPQRFQGALVKRTVVGLRAVLAEMGMISKRPVAMGEPPVVCARSFWQYTSRGGLLEVFPRVTDTVSKGEVIARLTDAFGDLVEEYRADAGGVVVGHSVDPVAHTGARIAHIGVLATPEDGLGW